MNIDFNHLEQLIKIAENADIHALEVTDGEMRINIICQPNHHLAGAPVASSSSPLAAQTASADTTSTPDTLDNNDTEKEAPSEPNAAAHEVPAPMLGTFYRRSSPDAEAFVEIGASVEADQTLCIIEAMKMMHEVKAETAGVITKILVDDGDIVEYGQALLKLDPNQ